MRLDHVNISCSDLAATKAFLEATLGLQDGWRPAFGFPGHWLVDDDQRPVVHLIPARRTIEGTNAVDHVAFHFDDLTTQLDRLRSLGHELTVREVPGTGNHQCFVPGPDGIVIECLGPLRMTEMPDAAG